MEWFSVPFFRTGVTAELVATHGERRHWLGESKIEEQGRALGPLSCRKDGLATEFMSARFDLKGDAVFRPPGFEFRYAVGIAGVIGGELHCGAAAFRDGYGQF